MYTLKAPAFLKPSSRPSSPALSPSSNSTGTSPNPPRSDQQPSTLERSRTSHRLSLGTFRISSPARNGTPATSSSSSASAAVATAAPLTQDGSYLEALSLKFNEAVAKALAQPTGPANASEQLGGRRPIPSGRGYALGALIASELQASKDNPHIHRAAIRSLHRPLSVLLSNVSDQLLPLLSSPAFHTPPAPTVQSPSPNPTQLHALGLSTFSGELLEKFDELSLGLDADPRGDGLKGIREGLVSMVSKTVNPLVMGIRNELLPIVGRLNTPHTPSGNGNGKHNGSKVHPAVVALQGVMPIYARAMSRYITTLPSQAALATFLLSVIWHALVAIAYRPYQPSPPDSPQTHNPTTSQQGQQPRRTPPSSPPVTPGSSRFTIKLPPSRPPSPPSSQVPSAAADASALYTLLTLFPRPSCEKTSTKLAGEAVTEALDALKALGEFLKVMHGSGSAVKKLSIEELTRMTEDIPTLVALPIILNAMPTSRVAAGTETEANPQPQPPPKSVASMLGMDEDAYRNTCLTGFSRADECADAVAQRLFDVFPASSVIAKWLEEEVADDSDDGH